MQPPAQIDSEFEEDEDESKKASIISNESQYENTESDYAEAHEVMRVNLTELMPGKLLNIPIKIAGTKYEALIDTGATADIIRENFLIKAAAALDLTK